MGAHCHQPMTRVEKIETGDICPQFVDIFLTTLEIFCIRFAMDRQNMDFKIVLQNELIDRCRYYPNYSLRRFAKSLQVDHSLLAKYLNGKRKIPKAAVYRIGKKLCLSPSEIDSMTDFPAGTKRKYNLLSDDSFRVISEWYHFAILELMNLKSFCPDATWIATKLGISKNEANIALERLLRIGLVAKKGQSFTHTNKNNTWDSSVTTDARKNLQRQLLEKSLLALESLPFEVREHSSLTVAIDKKYLPKIKTRVQNFKDELDQFLTKTNKNELDSVYQIQISVFPLTKLEGEV